MRSTSRASSTAGSRRRRSRQGRLLAHSLDRSRGARLARAGGGFRGGVAVGSGKGNARDEFRREPADALALRRRARRTGVMSVEAQEADEADTFCAVVPGKCVRACWRRPIAARTNRSARSRRSSPRTRSPKVGAVHQDQLRLRRSPRVVNRLTEEYATEHNVQNPPLVNKFAPTGRSPSPRKGGGPLHASASMEQQARTTVRAHQRTAPKEQSTKRAKEIAARTVHQGAGPARVRRAPRLALRRSILGVAVGGGPPRKPSEGPQNSTAKRIHGRSKMSRSWLG